MSDAWETLAALSTAGDAWERLHDITTGNGTIVLQGQLESNTAGELSADIESIATCNAILADLSADVEQAASADVINTTMSADFITEI